MPTQHSTTGIVSPKLSTAKIFKNSNLYIYMCVCVCVCVHIYLYKKANNRILCINSSNSFSRFYSHLNKIMETSSTLHLKKKSKKQILRKQQSSVTFCGTRHHIFPRRRKYCLSTFAKSHRILTQEGR